jgi:hypothetical protein
MESMASRDSPFGVLSGLQRQIDASNLTSAFSQMEQQLEPLRQLQRQIDASGLTSAFSRMEQQLEPLRQLQRQIDASGLTSAFSRMDQQLEPLRQLQRQIDASGLTSAFSQLQQQLGSMRDSTALVRAQIDRFRLDPDLTAAASQIDRALDISRHAIRNILNHQVPVVSELPRPNDPDTNATPSDEQRTQALQTTQHAALADAVAQLFAVVGIDPYFLRVWVETITSSDATQDEVKEMNAGLIELLNYLVPPNDEPDE